MPTIKINHETSLQIILWLNALITTTRTLAHMSNSYKISPVYIHVSDYKNNEYLLNSVALT